MDSYRRRASVSILVFAWTLRGPCKQRMPLGRPLDHAPAKNIGPEKGSAEPAVGDQLEPRMQNRLSLTTPQGVIDSLVFVQREDVYFAAVCSFEEISSGKQQAMKFFFLSFFLFARLFE